jgi:hypothetical protein
MPEEHESMDGGTIPELFARFCEVNQFPEEVVRLFEFYYQRALEEGETG